MEAAATNTVERDQNYINPVTYEKLITANRDGAIDAHSAKIRERELTYIERWHAAGNGSRGTGAIEDSLSGLAISGGGIRSATFALGITQAFAAQDLMRKFDYLSTVSGGGYLGSSLTWLTRGVPHPHHASDSPMTFSMACDRFPYPVDPPRKQEDRLAQPAQDAQLVYLRQHGKYLTPGNGIDLVSGIAVALRGLLLNMLVWLPLTAFALYCLLRLPGWLHSYLGLPEWSGSGLLGTSLAKTPAYEAIGMIAAAAVFIFAVLSIRYSLATYKTGTDTEWRYQRRRFFEKHIRYALWTLAAAVPLALIPVAATNVPVWLSSVGFASVVAGLASAVAAFMNARATANRGGSIVSIVAPLGSVCLLYGLLILAYFWAESVHSSDAHGWPWWSLVVLTGTAIVTGMRVNVNLISMHRYYRDRLMEAFLPDPPEAFAPHPSDARNGRTEYSGLATRADGFRLHDLSRDPPTGPYHLINTNVILVDSRDRKFRTRGGDSFVLSPLYSGSNATGWCRTEKFLGGDMTLSTAMAISGAAANPYAGGGLFRNRLVTVLMALVNVRLGYWVSHPESSVAKRRSHFVTAWRELSGKLDEKRPLLQLSDGGHFDNLGVYELIRRRVRVIVACDGTADPDFGFSDFITLLERIEADFGARITFDEVHGNGLEVFMPAKRAGFPRNAQLGKRGFTVGQITYSDGTTGQLIYVTTTLFKGLGLQTLGYRAANPDFPDQSTADQFFDESQFEAYRQLGYTVGEQVLSNAECRRILGLRPAPQPPGGQARPQPAGIRSSALATIELLGSETRPNTISSDVT